MEGLKEEKKPKVFAVSEMLLRETLGFIHGLHLDGSLSPKRDAIIKAFDTVKEAEDTPGPKPEKETP